MEDDLPSALDKVDRAVIMVSPFPELKPIKPEGKPASDVVSILSALLPALIDQARFKPSAIVLAADPKYGSRYLIGPSRVTSDGKEQRYGIASGLLNGFGEFVARSFRDHDYQLGRRNCQRFLQATFALPAGNDIIKSWQEVPIKANSQPFRRRTRKSATPRTHIASFRCSAPPKQKSPYQHGRAFHNPVSTHCKRASASASTAWRQDC